MTSRGKRLLKLALDGTYNNDQASESPADDSDKDPDYEPERKGEKHISQYFKDIDIFPSPEKSKDDPDDRQPVSKKVKIVNYVDETNVFPSPPSWEFQRLSKSESKTVIENANLLVLSPWLPIQTNNPSDDNIYFELQTVDNNQTLDQPSTSKITDNNDETAFPSDLNTDGIIVSVLTKTPVDIHNSVENHLGESEMSSHAQVDYQEPNLQNIHDITEQEPHTKRIRSIDLKKQKKINKPPRSEELQFLPPCQKTCRKKCFEKLSSDQRNQIFVYFKTLTFGERQLFLDKYILKRPVKYRKVDAETNKSSSIVYNLPVIANSPLVSDNQVLNLLTSTITKTNELQNVPNETLVPPKNTNPVELSETFSSSNIISVCKTMFLHTIGYKSDGIITNFLRRTVNDLPCLEDKRGKANALKMKDVGEQNYKAVKEHIETFHPQVSHYNIEHAPNRRYLPCDITIRQMYKDFISKYKHLSYETYRKIFEKENIGFSSPTQDDCSVCSVFKHHSHSEVPNASKQFSTNSSPSSHTSETSSKDPETETTISCNNELQSCSICDNYQIHKRRYTVARQKYNDDTGEKWDDNYELYTVDMQKVLILPKMTIKNSFFVSRLVVFHETFANLKPTGQNKCVLWHEAITGRNGPDVVSAYYNALIRLNNETKHVIFWTDNCTAQNKNWVLFTACIIFVNEEWGPETITFKYFEPGHSFMKADSIHGQIGKKWNKTPEILDYEDLEKLIKSSNKLNSIVSLRAGDFRLFENGCIQRKKGSALPKLGDIKSVQFRKGSRKLFFKKELEDNEFSEASVLKPKFKLELPKSVESERGINSKKKEVIVKELLPHMPPRKQIFWNSLPSSDNLEDLGKSIPQI